MSPWHFVLKGVLSFFGGWGRREAKLLFLFPAKVDSPAQGGGALQVPAVGLASALPKPCSQGAHQGCEEPLLVAQPLQCELLELLATWWPPQGLGARGRGQSVVEIGAWQGKSLQL